MECIHIILAHDCVLPPHDHQLYLLTPLCSYFNDIVNRNKQSQPYCLCFSQYVRHFNKITSQAFHSARVLCSDLHSCVHLLSHVRSLGKYNASSLLLQLKSRGCIICIRYKRFLFFFSAWQGTGLGHCKCNARVRFLDTPLNFKP